MRLEDGAELAGGRVEAQLDLDVERLAVVGHRHDGEVSTAGPAGTVMRVSPKPTSVKRERGPVEVGGELVGDLDALGRGGGRAGPGRARCRGRGSRS